MYDGAGGAGDTRGRLLVQFPLLALVAVGVESMCIAFDASDTRVGAT